MNRFAFLGMIAMVGCADLEQPAAPEEGTQAQGISRSDAPQYLEVQAPGGSSLPPIQITVVSAAVAPPGCNSGAFCANSGFSGTGSLLLEVQGNFSGSVPGVASVFNNGVKFPGADHVQLDWVWFDGTTSSRCLHYNPGPGVFAVNFNPAPIRITRVRWRGECGANEDF